MKVWKLRDNLKFDLRSYENINILVVPTYRPYKAISVLEEMDALIIKAMDQNFVPVVDDNGSFIGIITRKSIIKYLMDKKIGFN